MHMEYWRENTGEKGAMLRKNSRNLERDLLEFCMKTKLWMCRIRLHKLGKEQLLRNNQLPENYKLNSYQNSHRTGKHSNSIQTSKRPH